MGWVRLMDGFAVGSNILAFVGSLEEGNLFGDRPSWAAQLVGVVVGLQVGVKVSASLGAPDSDGD